MQAAGVCWLTPPQCGARIAANAIARGEMLLTIQIVALRSSGAADSDRSYVANAIASSVTRRMTKAITRGSRIPRIARLTAPTAKMPVESRMRVMSAGISSVAGNA
jgi:hypothetical protein